MYKKFTLTMHTIALTCTGIYYLHAGEYSSTLDRQTLTHAVEIMKLENRAVSPDDEFYTQIQRNLDMCFSNPCDFFTRSLDIKPRRMKRTKKALINYVAGQIFTLNGMNIMAIQPAPSVGLQLRNAFLQQQTEDISAYISNQERDNRGDNNWIFSALGCSSFAAATTYGLLACGYSTPVVFTAACSQACCVAFCCASDRA